MATKHVYVQVNGLKKHYGDGDARLTVLDGIDTSINRGEICVMLGPSGSGKSTFLNLIGGLEDADGGSIVVDGCDLTVLKPADLGEYRRRELGFVFQFYNLVPDLTIKENIEVTAHLSKKPLDVDDLLRSLGLYEHRNKFPRQVSGGQQQRCAIGRALVKNPGLLLCDEPTGALDYKTLFILFFPFQKSLQKAASPSGKSTAFSGVLAFFMKYKRFTIVLIGCILLYISHVFINNFTFQIVETKGGTSADMGVAMALGSVLELPTMFLFGYMQKKARCDIWFRISGIFFTLKILFSLLVTNMAAFYVIQIFQMGGWALISVSSVYYVNSIMEPEDAIKGQAYITMTYTLGSVLGAVLGGTLLDHAGVNAMLITGTIAALVGAVLLLFASERPRQQR